MVVLWGGVAECRVGAIAVIGPVWIVLLARFPGNEGETGGIP
jgi:hypothetical protein